MRKRRRLITVASILVLTALLNDLAVSYYFGDALGARDFIRFGLTLLLALGLVAAQEWARLLTVGLSALGAIVSISTVFVVQVYNDDTGPWTPIHYWIVILAAVYGFISIFLFTSKGVTREIQRAHH